MLRLIAFVSFGIALLPLGVASAQQDLVEMPEETPTSIQTEWWKERLLRRVQLHVAQSISVHLRARMSLDKEYWPVTDGSVLPDNALSVAPVNQYIGAWSFEYERAVSNRISLFISPLYRTTDPVYGLPSDSWGVNAGARYFFAVFMEAPFGMFISPEAYLEASTLKTATSGEEGSASLRLFGLGAMLGSTTLPLNRSFPFFTSFGFGLGAHASVVESRPELGPAMARNGFGVMFIGRWNVGMAF
jgi:hypothetical protein